MRPRASAFVAIAFAAAAVLATCSRGGAPEQPSGAPADRGAVAARGERPAAQRVSGHRGDRHARAAARLAPVVKKVEGTVARAGQREVVIRARGAPVMTLRVSPRTTVTVDGQPARADELTEGAPVRASYEDGGVVRATALSIEAGATRGPDATWKAPSGSPPVEGG